jgi:hypothetical protein
VDFVQDASEDIRQPDNLLIKREMQSLSLLTFQKAALNLESNLCRQSCWSIVIVMPAKLRFDSGLIPARETAHD